MYSANQKDGLLTCSVIYEDNHLLVVNKPSGILVQGDRTGDESLLDHGKRYIQKKYNKPGKVFLGLPHRLDRPVSGVVVLARTSKALERLNEAFRTKKIEKIYWAVIRSLPPDLSGNLTHWLIKDTKKNRVSAYDKERKGAVRADLEYRTLATIGDESLLEIKLITGRSHQIRVQLHAMGCPVKGDLKYGAPDPNPDGSICLHARTLTFTHPVRKEPVTFTADLPQKNWTAFLHFQ